MIAFALWLGVTGLSTPTVKRFTVPLVPSVANNMQVTNQLISDVEIVLTGDKRELERLNRNDLSATLDLTDSPAGDRVVALSPENVYVGLPQGIKLSEVQPGRIAVVLESVGEKDVGVEPKLAGAAVDGLEVYSSTSLPPRVRVRAATSVLGTLTSLSTDPIDITGKRESFTAHQVAVRSSLPNVAVYSTVVDVVVRLGEKRVERTFTVPAPGLPGKTVTFSIFGPKAAVTRAKAEDFKVEIVLGDNGEETPQVTLPSDLIDGGEVRRAKIS